MTVPTTTTYDDLLQDLYSTERLVDMVVQTCPTLARLKKTTDLVGRRHVFAVKYAGNEAVNSTIAAAQTALTAASNGTAAVDFQLTRKTLLGVARIDMELLDTAFENKGAFVDAMDEETSSIEKAFVARLGAMVFENGGGALGRISATSNVATKTITLADPRDAIKFRPGMILQADNTDGSGGGAVHAGTETVESVNYDNGQIRCVSATWQTVIGGIAASDWLFPQNAFGAGWAGFEAWCPLTAPTAGDSFYGVDRSVSVSKLAGVRTAASGGSIEDALINAAIENARLGLKAKQIIMNPYRTGLLVREQAGRSTYVRTDSSKVAMGASSLTLMVPTINGAIEIISDPFCQSDTAWFVDLDDFSVRATKSGYCHIQKNKETGFMWFPVSTLNQIEMRMASYANLKCRNPGNVQRCDF